MLYHYTCAHAADSIGTQGLLRPRRHPLLPGLPPVVWLTDLAAPDRVGLGLTSSILGCDRTGFRYEVRVLNASAFYHWPELRDSGRYELDPAMVRTLEHGRVTRRWWLSTIPLHAVRAPAVRSGGEVSAR